MLSDFFSVGEKRKLLLSEAVSVVIAVLLNWPTCLPYFNSTFGTEIKLADDMMTFGFSTRTTAVYFFFGSF